MRPMAGAADLVHEAFRTEEREFDWRGGAAGTIAAVGPLAIGLALDEPVAGFVATLGGLNAALCVPRARLSARTWWGLLALAGQTVAAVLADAVDGSDALLVAATVAWVGGWAFCRAVGPAGALLGFATAAVFVILAGIPSGATLGEQLRWVLLGGVPGVALMIAARGGQDLALEHGS